MNFLTAHQRKLGSGRESKVAGNVDPIQESSGPEIGAAMSIQFNGLPGEAGAKDLANTQNPDSAEQEPTGEKTKTRKAKKKSTKKAAKQKTRKKAKKKKKAKSKKTSTDVDSKISEDEPAPAATVEPAPAPEEVALETPPELDSPALPIAVSPAAPAEVAASELSPVPAAPVQQTDQLADTIGTAGLMGLRAAAAGPGTDDSIGIDLSGLEQAMAQDKQASPGEPASPTPSPSLAQSPAPPVASAVRSAPVSVSGGGVGEIAIIDLYRINKNVRREKEADEVRQFREEMLQKIQHARQGADKEFAKRKQLLGPYPTPLQQEKLEDLQTQGQQSIKQVQEVAAQELAKLRQQWSSKLRQEIGPYVQQVAARLGRSLVLLRSEAMLYASPAADITDQVIAAMIDSGQWSRRPANPPTANPTASAVQGTPGAPGSLASPVAPAPLRAPATA